MEATRTDLDLVLSVLRDGQRMDRYLRRDYNGRLSTTPDCTFLTSVGPETPPYVEIPVAMDTTEDEEEAWALQLIEDLDS